MFQIKDVVKRPTIKNIKDLRCHYNQVIDSVFYLIEDITESEKIISDKYKQLAKLQAQARMIDQLINDSISNGNNKNRRAEGHRKGKNLEVFYLEKLSELCTTLQTKQNTHPKKQTKNRK
jgi:HPt (histidine-containing phosphotransfer) domain-containing protein